MNKRTIVIFASLAAVVVIAVILCVLFVIGEVIVQPDVSFELSAQESAKIIQDSKIVVHSSIFGLDEEIAARNIESKNPKIKVTDIVRKAPNKVCINITRRVPVFYAAVSEGGYALIDGELHIVELSDSLEEDAFLCRIEGKMLSDAIEGGVVNDLSVLQDVYRAARGMSFKDKRFGTFFPSIGCDGKQVLLTTNTGAVLCVNAAGEIETMMRGAYNAYLSSQEKRYGGYWYYTASGWMHADTLPS